MAQDWNQRGSTTLADMLNQEAYRNYLADALQRAQDGAGPAMGYDDWRNVNSQGYNLPQGADLSQYTLNTSQSDGTNWGGQLNQTLTQNGASDPIYSNTWENGGMITPGQVALTAAALFGGGYAMAGGAAGGAAGAGLGEAGSVGAGLAAPEGVTALGAGWSPAGLGLTGATGGGLSAAELASLTSALPGAVEAAGGLGAAGGVATLGGGGSGVTSLGSAWSPEALGLSGGITPSVGASELAGLSQGIPGAVGAGATSGIGGSGGMSSADRAAIYGSEGYGPGMSGAQTSVYDGLLNSTGSKGIADLAANSGIGESIIKGGSSLLDGAKGVSDLVGGGQNLAGLIGAGLGAASGGGTETSSRDPWSAAQPYLKNILADAETQRANLAANPFTPQQTQQYQQAYSGLDQARGAMPGLLNWGQQAMQRQSTTPSYESLFGGQASGGLLGRQPQQATAQAGGPGGLLGNDDRLKALMARGRGLIG
ncbi:hypothetical protein [Roseateles sp. P5_E11]